MHDKPVTVQRAFEILFMNPRLPDGQRKWVEDLERAWAESGLSTRQREVLSSILAKFDPLLEAREIEECDYGE